MTTIKVDKIVRKHYIEHQGTPVEVRQTADPSLYSKGVAVYENILAKGAKAGSSEYWVAPDDFVPAKRVSNAVATANSVQSMLAQGLSADEIVAKLSEVKN